jgi:hypothetical protein
MKKNLFLSAFVVCVCCSPIKAEQRPEAFLKEYVEKSKTLVEKYEHLHLTGSIEERVGGKSEISNIELFHDGDKMKIVRSHEKGDELYRQKTTVAVATPDTSFILNKLPTQEEFSLDLFGREMDKASTHARLKVDIESSTFQSPFICIGVPLLKFLAMKETKILSVKDERDGDKLTCHVSTRTSPFDPDFEGWCDHIEGSFLFEPASYWTTRKYTLKYWETTGKLRTILTCSVDYREPINDIPVLSRIECGILDGKGELGRGYYADIKTIKFGPVPPEEFTLRGCGFGEDLKSKRPTIFYWSIGIALLAFVLIVVLRRRRVKTAPVNPQRP